VHCTTILLRRTRQSLAFEREQQGWIHHPGQLPRRFFIVLNGEFAASRPLQHPPNRGGGTIFEIREFLLSNPGDSSIIFVTVNKKVIGSRNFLAGSDVKITVGIFTRMKEWWGI
jgi:hypothetical protein